MLRYCRGWYIYTMPVHVWALSFATLRAVREHTIVHARSIALKVDYFRSELLSSSSPASSIRGTRCCWYAYAFAPHAIICATNIHTILLFSNNNWITLHVLHTNRSHTQAHTRTASHICHANTTVRLFSTFVHVCSACVMSYRLSVNKRPGLWSLLCKVRTHEDVHCVCIALFCDANIFFFPNCQHIRARIRQHTHSTRHPRHRQGLGLSVFVLFPIT